MRQTFLTGSIIFMAWLGIVAQPVQDDLPAITRCIALVNAKVVSKPGQAPITATIIMRDGLITALGSQVEIPKDAYRVPADSLYAYPAFVDAFSSIGIKDPDAENQQNQGGPGNRSQRTEVDAEGNPSLENAGITPFQNIRPAFDPKSSAISDWRAMGFAVSHVVPRGKMIPGKGSVIVLTGKNLDQMLWKENVSLYSQWTGSGSAYPTTSIGVAAKWRELYHNAAHAAEHQQYYEQASLVSRPFYNQAHLALIPVVKKEIPVFFRAPKVKDISRALELQKDLGMKMVIADAEEAWYYTDRLKTTSTPLVLSLDLPEDKKKDDKEGKGPVKPKASDADSDMVDDSTKSITPDTVEIDPEKEAFEKRRAESLKAHYEQASVLAKSGVPFSFGTMSVKTGDFMKNIRLMIENGLSADQTLEALTTQPARLLGVEKYCGSLEVGKMANVLVSTGPLFEEESAIRYMIVEGGLYAYEAKEKKKSNGNVAPAVADKLQGTWNYTMDTPDKKREGTMEFTYSGGSFTGKISGTDFTSGMDELEDIVVEGDNVSFTLDFNADGQIVVIEFDLKLHGESFDGTITPGEFGTFPISGQRTNKPN